MHRAGFEDALDAWLREQLPGVTVAGGGTSLGQDGAGPMSCEIEVQLRSSSREEVDAIVRAMDRIGAPKDSKAAVDGEDVARFGTLEGLGLFLNGTDLPDEVYANSDVNELINLLGEALGDEGRLASWWEGPRETCLYFYGRSFDEIRQRVGAVIERHPLAQLSRVEQIA